MQVPEGEKGRGSDAAIAGNVVAGSVAQDAAQDTAMLVEEEADGRRTSPCEGQDDEE